MTKKGNQRYVTLLSSCFSLRKRCFILTLILSMFMLFGCSSSRGQVTSNTLRSETAMLAKIESHYKKWQGTPYRYGGTTLAGSDCSALVMNFFKNKLAKRLPRSAAEQAKLGFKVTKPKAGDLVFFKTGGRGSGLHVGIYYTDGKFLHASTSKGVIYSNLNETYWKKRYWMARRINDI